MILDPILDAPLAIQIHVFTVVPAAVLAAVMLVMRKGTPIHKIIGRVWVGLMAVTAISTFFIHSIRMAGPFSPIHLLSIFTLWGCVIIVWSARTGRFDVHRRNVLSLIWGGLGVAGAFTLAPGRIMNQVLFGGMNVGWTPAIVLTVISTVALVVIQRSGMARAPQTPSTARN